MRRIEVVKKHLLPTTDSPTYLATAPSSSTKEGVVIVSYSRTPIGGFLGSLSSLSAPQLGAIAIKSAVERANIDPSLVDEVFFGCVLTANVGQAPARQAALAAGLSNKTPCTTVNKVCASGMKAVMLAAQTILTDQAHIVVAGGMESMSNTPYYLGKGRGGYRMGNGELIDGMIKDGLWDPYGNHHMGICAEKCGTLYNISRTDQDAHAINSYKRALAASKEGAFNKEIVPVQVAGPKGQPPKIITDDDEYKSASIERLPTLNPSFKSDGTVTAGNASTISDGAAALVLMSESKAKQLGLAILARILSFADAAQEPVMFTTTPSVAISLALKRCNLTLKDIDYFEINEAFSVVALANQQILGLDPSRLNVYGGAVSIGHPIGCSGARIICTLLSVLQNKHAKRGCASICNGGGGASAIVIETVDL